LLSDFNEKNEITMTQKPQHPHSVRFSNVLMPFKISLKIHNQIMVKPKGKPGENGSLLYLDNSFDF